MHYPLTESFKNQEEKLIALIREAVPVERIYRLAATLEQQYTESIFVITAPTSSRVAHYYLLVLIDKECGHGEHYVQDKIENTCRSLVPVTVIVLKTAQFNNWLNEGHRFACTVLKAAVLLYENGNSRLPIPDCIKEEAVKEISESNLSQPINKVNEFIVGAELFRLRKQNKMTAFMLHQAAEHALHTILKRATGLRVNTHNIDKLIRYCSMAVYQLPGIFPKDNEANKRICMLLQKAYIDSRYKDDYYVSTDELVIITIRVRMLEVILQEM